MSVKNRDPKGHWRCKTVAFRVSPEEGQRLDMQVKTSGSVKYFSQNGLQGLA